MTRPPGVALGGISNLALRIIQALADTLVVFITARGFGADGRGLYALTSLALAFGGVLFGGVAAPLAAEIAHRRAALGQLHASSLGISLLGGGIVGALAILVGMWTDEPALVYAAIVLPFYTLMYFQTALFQATGDVLRFGWFTAAMSISAAVSLGVAAVMFPGDIKKALWIWASSQLLVPIFTLRRQYVHGGFQWDGVRTISRRLLLRGAPFSLANGLQKLNYRVDVFVVAAYLPLASVGAYSVAVATGEALWQLSRAITTGAYSRIIESDNKTSATLSLRVFRHSTLFLAVGGGIVVVLAASTLDELLGSEFGDVWYLLALLLPGVIGLGAGEVLRPFMLIRLERSRDFLVAATLGMLVNLILAILLVPAIGLVGAALSTSIAYILGTGYMLFRFATMSGRHDFRAYVPGIAEGSDYYKLGQRVLRRMKGLAARPQGSSDG